MGSQKSGYGLATKQATTARLLALTGALKQVQNVVSIVLPLGPFPSQGTSAFEVVAAQALSSTLASSVRGTSTVGARAAESHVQILVLQSEDSTMKGKTPGSKA